MVSGDFVRKLATEEEVMNRDYKMEYQTYQGKPEQIKNRAERNQARATLAKAGVVKKGDGQDVDHARPIAKGGTNARSNLRALPKSQNRSFARTKGAGMK
jgi:5-methylcytosine-specific restriction endonuclease McrA